MIYIALGIGFTTAALLLFFWLQRKGRALGKSGVGISIDVYSLNQAEMQNLIQSFADVAEQHGATILDRTAVSESSYGYGCLVSTIQIGNLTKPATDALSQHQLPEKSFAVLSMIIEGELQTDQKSDLEELEFQAKLWSHLGHAENAERVGQAIEDLKRVND